MFTPNDPGPHSPWDNGSHNPWDKPPQPPASPLFPSSSMFGDLNRDGREDSWDDLLGLFLVSHWARQRQQEAQGSYGGASSGNTAAAVTILAGAAIAVCVCLASALQR